MTSTDVFLPDPTLDLVLERNIDVPPHLVWKAWTEPEHLKPWFTPKPWQTVHCEIDLRPGGKFRTIMRGPEGQEFDNSGCYLEVIPMKRLVWTDALLPGYRPSPEPFMTAILTFEVKGAGTRYVATAVHRDVENRKKHEKMGFFQGWGTALDQLLAYVKSL